MCYTLGYRESGGGVLCADDVLRVLRECKLAEIIDNHVSLRVHCTSSPEKVFEFLTTDAGRKAFWADFAVERDGVIHFQFSNGMEHHGKVIETIPHRRFSVEYFGGSKATFELEEAEGGGTDLTLTESKIPGEWAAEHKAGWVTVLLTLKAAVDFSVDLRNTDPLRNWANGYVDV